MKRKSKTTEEMTAEFIADVISRRPRFSSARLARLRVLLTTPETTR